MNYSVATVILLMVLGAAMLMDHKPTATQSNGEKWYTTRVIIKKAKYGSDEVIPQGAEVEFIDKKTISFRGVTFEVAPGDLISASEKAQEAARRKSVEEELASVDKEIKEMEDELARTYYAPPPKMKSRAREQQSQRNVLVEEVKRLVERREKIAQQLQ